MDSRREIPNLPRMTLDHTLYQFLITTGALPLPGLGTLRLQKNSATYDVAEKAFLPPSFQFALTEEDVTSSRPLFEWISSNLQVEEGEAIHFVNGFANRIKQELQDSRKSVWEGVGQFKKDLAGVLQFESTVLQPAGMAPVKAERVVHAEASHTMLVGDQERTREEMTAWLEEETTPRDWTQWIAWILLGLSLLYLGFHFSKAASGPSSFGNQQSVHARP